MDNRCRQHPFSSGKPDKPDIGRTVIAPNARVGIVVARRRLSTRCPLSEMSGLSGFYVGRERSASHYFIIDANDLAHSPIFARARGAGFSDIRT